MKGLPPLGDLPRDHIADANNTAVNPWNIANALTVLRLILVPVFAVALFWDGGHRNSWHWIAAGIFAVASLTDSLDGRLARSRGLVTDFGKLMDPIADKALVGTALIGLSILGDLNWIVTVLMVAREIGVTVLRFWVVRHGVISASRGGKLKTVLQTVALLLYMVVEHHGFAYAIAWITMFLAVLVAVLTGLDYVSRALKLRRDSKARIASQKATSELG